MRSLITLIVLIGVAVSVQSSKDDPHSLTWPDAYTAAGNIVLPYAELNEPFQAYIDVSAKLGRIDFYGGVTSIVYRGDVGQYGTLYKTVPVTMNDSYNIPTCYALAGNKDQPVVPQVVFPDVTLYKFAAKITYKGEDSLVYTSSFTENNRDSNYTLIVSAKDNTPKELSFVGFDRLMGSHYDQYVITYTSVLFKKPDAKYFQVTANDTCKDSFPGPGYTNPMSETMFYELMGPTELRTRHIDEAFKSFKSSYGKEYDNEKEEAHRRLNFHHNYRFVKSRSKMSSTYTVALNHLADLSDGEMKKMRGYRNTGINSKFEYSSNVVVSDIPDYMNWWLRGAVTPVKDQAICGSCWSFGTTGTLEGSLFIKTGKLVSLSEQAFVDCSWGQGNNGCDGGESERAYEWLLLGRCVPTEASYPYLMQDSRCHDKDATCGARITKYYNVQSGNVTDLKVKIFERGPISIAIDASHRSFSFYANGVYVEPECGNTPDDLDHQVLAVGYGTLNGKEFVLVKNSWSTHWGFDGYVLMSTDGNQCGISTDASFADVM